MVLSRVTRATFFLSLVLLSIHGTATDASNDNGGVGETNIRQGSKIHRIRKLAAFEEDIDAQIASVAGVHKNAPHEASLWPYMAKQLRQSDKAILETRTETESTGGRPMASSLSYSFEAFEKSAVIWRGIGGVMSMDPGNDDMPSESPPSATESPASGDVPPPSGDMPPPSGDVPSESPPSATESPASGDMPPPSGDVPSATPPSGDAPSETPTSDNMTPETMPPSLAPVSATQPDTPSSESPVSGRDPSPDPVPTPEPVDRTLSPTAPPTRAKNDPNGNAGGGGGGGGDDGNNRRLILGASLGAVAGVSVLACCAVLICQWKKKNAGPPAPLPA